MWPFHIVFSPNRNLGPFEFNHPLGLAVNVLFSLSVQSILLSELFVLVIHRMVAVVPVVQDQ